jgi:hypothetical protein
LFGGPDPGYACARCDKLHDISIIAMGDWRFGAYINICTCYNSR